MSVEVAAAIVADAMRKEKTAKATPKAAAKGAKRRPAATCPGKAGKATVRVEESRSQVVAHFGTGPGSCKSFRWGKDRSKTQAIKAAEGWLQEKVG